MYNFDKSTWINLIARITIHVFTYSYYKRLVACTYKALGPLRTQAKSQDHETVRAQKESVQRSSQDTSKSCSVKSYVTGPSIKFYFNDFLFMRVLAHDRID